jgi:sugar diacid utilization regulator
MAIAAELTITAGLGDHEAAHLLIRKRIEIALEHAGGNICRAAAVLQVHRNTLTRRLVQFDLTTLPWKIRRAKQRQQQFSFSKKPAGRLQQDLGRRREFAG